ncbi:class I SAM-dependent methyltransferase [Litoribacillus peritrichatus]|uniref:Methyltransferase domain-containing protein n=1 Tax=Litoribacillus peritrichatus TaxID=718191 RepID=A0ABP7M5W3_9GAMM
MRDKYKYIGPLYDFLSSIYGGESIHDCKRAMLTEENVKAGDKILIAGAGHGKDAIRAAELGADVTVVDLSETMLIKLKQAFEKHPGNLNVNVVHADILTFEEYETYDMVIANFFLNVFYEDFMEKITDHLIKCTKQGGKFVIGDFAYPNGNPISNTIQKGYWYTAALIFYVTSDNAIHEIYNYTELMKSKGLEVSETKHYRYLGMNCYASVMGTKVVASDLSAETKTEQPEEATA